MAKNQKQIVEFPQPRSIQMSLLELPSECQIQKNSDYNMQNNQSDIKTNDHEQFSQSNGQINSSNEMNSVNHDGVIKKIKNKYKSNLQVIDSQLSQYEMQPSQLLKPNNGNSNINKTMPRQQNKNLSSRDISHNYGQHSQKLEPNDLISNNPHANTCNKLKEGDEIETRVEVEGSISESSLMSLKTSQQNESQQPFEPNRNIDLATKQMTDVIRDRIALQEKLKLNQELLSRQKMEEQLFRQMQEADEELQKTLKAEEIYNVPYKYAQGTDSPVWNKKQIGKQTKHDNLKTNNSEESLSISDHSSSDEEEDNKIKEQEQINEIQQKLLTAGDKIKIQTTKNIKPEKYPEQFKYKIYDGYLTENLAQTRDYFKYIQTVNMGGIAQQNKHMQKYLANPLDTKFPNYINQKNILRFDQNFECGNLDSAYLFNDNNYNLLMKVDTNTKGNTYWFMYKVSNFKIGTTVRFNILNFTRSMEGFYRDGMNVVTRAEQQDCEIATPQYTQAKTEESEEEMKPDIWRYGTCKNIHFGSSDIIKSFSLSQKNGVEVRQNYYYYQLSFDYTFQQEDLGCYVYFCYARPYSYTNLLQDLNSCKKNLMMPDEEGKKPIHNVISKLRYTNETKFVNLYKDEEKVPLSNAKRRQILICKSSSLSIDDLDGSRSKKSKYELEKINIRKAGERQQAEKKTKFENQLEKDDELTRITQFEEEEEQENFELINDYLLFRQEVIAQSLGGLNVYQLTFTKKKTLNGALRYRRRQCIYIQARLHAAETHGSFIMSHIIHELSLNYRKYDAILNNYIIKLIPMVNPDGVVVGNSRSSLAGVDLNRRWSNPVPNIHPEIYFLKQNMAMTSKVQSGISLFCDLHGHNKLKNCFFYGCNKAPKQGLLSWTKTRILPKIFAQIEPLFDMNFCQFSQQATKYNTARVVVWNDFEVTNSFTLETSMYSKLTIGSDGKKKGTDNQIIPADFLSIGINLLKSITQLILVEKQLQKELAQTNGWLRKKMLDEVTGKTARKRLEEENLIKKQVQYDKSSKIPDLFEKQTKKIETSALRSSRAITSHSINSAQVSFKIKRTQIDLNADQMKPIVVKKKNNSQKYKTFKDQKIVLPILDQKEDIPKCLEQFFSMNEMVNLVNEFDQPPKKQSKNKEQKIEESDSEPSCDNMDQEELGTCFEVILDDKQKLDLEKQRSKKAEKDNILLVPDSPFKDTRSNGNDSAFNFILANTKVKEHIKPEKVEIILKPTQIIVPNSHDIRKKAASPKPELLDIQSDHQKFKQSWIEEKEKIQKRAIQQDLINQETKKRNINRGKSEDYRLLCEKLMEAKQKTKNLQNKYNDVKETLQANYLNYEKPLALEFPVQQQFPHVSQSRDEQMNFTKLTQAQQQDYLGINSQSKRNIEAKKMSSFIDNCLLPVVNKHQGIGLRLESPVKKSRNRIGFAPSEGFCNNDAQMTLPYNPRASRQIETINQNHLRNRSSNMVGQSQNLARNSILQQEGEYVGSPKALFRQKQIDENVLYQIESHILTFQSPNKGDGEEKNFFSTEQTAQTTGKKPKYSIQMLSNLEAPQNETKIISNNSHSNQIGSGQSQRTTIRQGNTVKNLFAMDTSGGLQQKKETRPGLPLSPNVQRRQAFQFPNVKQGLNSAAEQTTKRPRLGAAHLRVSSQTGIEQKEEYLITEEDLFPESYINFVNKPKNHTRYKSKQFKQKYNVQYSQESQKNLGTQLFENQQQQNIDHMAVQESGQGIISSQHSKFLNIPNRSGAYRLNPMSPSDVTSDGSKSENIPYRNAGISQGRELFRWDQVKMDQVKVSVNYNQPEEFTKMSNGQLSQNIRGNKVNIDTKLQVPINQIQITKFKRSFKMIKDAPGTPGVQDQKQQDLLMPSSGDSPQGKRKTIISKYKQ